MSKAVGPSGHLPTVIAYSALHQRIPSVTPSDYRSTMLSFHERLHAESLRLHTASIKHRKERENALVCSISALIAEEGAGIEKSIQEVIEGDRSGWPVTGLVRSSEAEVINASGRDAIKELLMNGEAYLRKLGFSDTPPPSVYESCFMVEGSANLDILETLVRDVLGIYGGTHGKHLREFGNYSYAVYNLLREGGGASFEAVSDKFQEASLYFSKPDPDVIKYAPFRNELVKMVSTLDGTGEVYSSLWQRKLGLGVGTEFVLRFAFEDEEDRIGEIVSGLAASSENPIVRSALLERGSLVLRNVTLARSVTVDG